MNSRGADGGNSRALDILGPLPETMDGNIFMLVIALDIIKFCGLSSDFFTNIPNLELIFLAYIPKILH
jgi:hypothetical protein